MFWYNYFVNLFVVYINFTKLLKISFSKFIYEKLLASSDSSIKENMEYNDGRPNFSFCCWFNRFEEGLFGCELKLFLINITKNFYYFII